MIKIAGNVVLPPSSTPAPVVESTKKAAFTKKPTAAEALAAKAVGGGENLAVILAALHKSKGDQIAISANAVKPVERLRTGIFEVDFYLGGGFPKGRYSIIYGPESSNKTNICYAAVAQAQRGPAKCNKAVWVNIEQTFDPAYAVLWGVDINELIIINPGYGEEASDVIDALVQADDVAILVVDSIAAMISSKEIAKSAEDHDVGTSAILIKRLVNKLMVCFGNSARRGHYPCVLLINQTRFKIGTPPGQNPETMPGGETQKFLASLRIRVSAQNIIVKTADPNVHVIKKTHVIVKKAKVPVISNDFSFDLIVKEHDGFSVGDTDSFGMVLKYLKQLELVENIVSGPKKGWKVHGITFKTQAEMQEFYQQDEDFRLILQGLVIDAFQGKGKMVDEPVQPTSPAAVEPGTMMSFAKPGPTIQGAPIDDGLEPSGVAGDFGANND